MPETRTRVVETNLLEINNVLLVEFTDALGRKLQLGARDLTMAEAIAAHGE